MNLSRTPLPHARACDSCGTPLQPKRIYVGFVGTLNLMVCEFCAKSAAAEQYTLMIVAQARLTIRQAHARLNTAAGVR